MHYYKLNIGDYRRDTGYLTMLEHGAYRQLLDTYYLNERPLSADDATLMRTHGARNADEVQAVKNVLKDYFLLTDEGWVHKYCDRIIAEFHGKSEQAKDAAKARWGNKKQPPSSKKAVCEVHADAMRTQCDSDANHKPLTINHEKPLSRPTTELPARSYIGGYAGDPDFLEDAHV